MLIRPANDSDAPSIAALTDSLGSGADAARVSMTPRHILDDNHQAVFVCDDERSGVVGWIHVYRTLRLQSPMFAEVGGMTVRSDSRRKGIGTALLRAANEWAQQHSLTKLRVRCRRDRLQAISFYESNDFQPKKEQSVLDRETKGR